MIKNKYYIDYYEDSDFFDVSIYVHKSLRQDFLNLINYVL